MGKQKETERSLSSLSAAKASLKETKESLTLLFENKELEQTGSQQSANDNNINIGSQGSANST